MTKTNTKNLSCLTLLASILTLSSCFVTKEFELFHEERHDLINLRDSLRSIVNLHSNWTGPPCYRGHSRWIGIKCAGSNVVAIVLEGIQLTGSLPQDSLQNVTYLAYLSFKNNALHGDLPSLKGLAYLEQVDFSLNRFSGNIPADFTTLPTLNQLYLEDNLLNGTIPPFNQSGLTAFNVSYNFLSGSVPVTPVLEAFPKSSFDHNLALCGDSLGKPCNEAQPVGPASPPRSPVSPHHGPAAPRTKAGAPPVLRPLPQHFHLGGWRLVLIAVGAAMVPFLAFCLFFYLLRRNKTTKTHSGILGVPSEYFEKTSKDSSQCKDHRKGDNELEFFNKEKAVFDIDTLFRSSAVVLGKGGLGITYKVALESGPLITVKRLRNVSGIAKKEFVQQLQLLGKLRHHNLVEIFGYNYSKEEKLVIYEHVAGSSLFQLLHDNRGAGRTPLRWESRLSIAKGISRGLNYLHQCLPFHKIPHANLKSSNVLIRNNQYHLPQITDFGFQPLLPHMHRLSVAKSPEFPQGKKLSFKSDVYCFGLLVLEMVTGKVPSESEEEVAMPQWVRLALKNEWSTDVLDLELVGEKEFHEEMLKLVEIALECTELEPEKRPKMSEVVLKIEELKGGERRSWV
ncbi:hypothetical protein LUZ60_014828 [Juncus effusus]|nr:hypothetical protein LUZ60_014828 [Juncus effusus]